MTQTKNAIGNLVNRYKAVLKKCNLLNAFGSLAVASILVLGMGGMGMANEGLNYSADVIDSLNSPDNSGHMLHVGAYLNKPESVREAYVIIDAGGTNKYYYGGFSRKDTFSAYNVSNNTVIYSGGDAFSVYGGYAYDEPDASNNTVIFSGGSLYYLHGGTTFGTSAASTGTSKDNTLVVIGKDGTVVRSVNDFQHYRFLLPADVAAGDTMLKITGTGASYYARIDKATVGVAFMKTPSNWQIGDSVTLINKTDGGSFRVVKASDANFLPITDNGKSYLVSQSYGFLDNYEFDVELDSSNPVDNPLIATLTTVTQKGDDANPYVNNGDGLDEYIKAAQDTGEIGEAFVNDMSKPAGVRFLSRAISGEFGNASIEAAKAVESAMNAITVAAFPQMTMSANMAAVGAVTQRTSIAMPLGNMRSATLVSDAGKQSGINAGDDISGMSAGNKYDKTGFGMWIMPLWQSNNTFGMKVGDNLEADTHASIGGIAIGADYTWDQMFRLGLTFNIGGGYAEGSGDFSKTTNNMNFWGIGAYAGWAYNNFGLTADVNYTSSYNKIKQELDSSFRLAHTPQITVCSARSGMNFSPA